MSKKNTKLGIENHFAIDLFLIEAGLEYQTLLLSTLPKEVEVDSTALRVLDNDYNSYLTEQIAKLSSSNQDTYKVKVEELLGYYAYHDSILLADFNNKKTIYDQIAQLNQDINNMFDSSVQAELNKHLKNVQDYDHLHNLYESSSDYAGAEDFFAQRARWKRLYFSRTAQSIRKNYVAPTEPATLTITSNEGSNGFNYDDAISHRQNKLDDIKRDYEINEAKYNKNEIDIIKYVGLQDPLITQVVKLEQEIKQLKKDKELSDKAKAKQKLKKDILYALIGLAINTLVDRINGNDTGSEEDKERAIELLALEAVDVVGTLVVAALTEGAGGPLFHALFNGLVIQTFLQENPKPNPELEALQAIMKGIDEIKNEIEESTQRIIKRMGNEFKEYYEKSQCQDLFNLMATSEIEINSLISDTSFVQKIPDLSDDVWTNLINFLNPRNSTNGFLTKHLLIVFEQTFGAVISQGQDTDDFFTLKPTYSISDTIDVYLKSLVQDLATKDIVEVGEVMENVYARVAYYMSNLDHSLIYLSKNLAYSYYEVGTSNDDPSQVNLRAQIKDCLSNFIEVYYYHPFKDKAGNSLKDKIILHDENSIFTQINYQLNRSFEEYIVSKAFSNTYYALSGPAPFVLHTKDAEGKHLPLTWNPSSIKDELGYVLKDDKSIVFKASDDATFMSYDYCNLYRFPLGLDKNKNVLYACGFLDFNGQISYLHDKLKNDHTRWKVNFKDIDISKLEKDWFGLKFIFDSSKGCLYIKNKEDEAIHLDFWSKEQPQIGQRLYDKDFYFKETASDFYVTSFREPYTLYLSNGTVINSNDNYTSREADCGYTLTFDDKEGKLIAYDDKDKDKTVLWSSGNTDKGDYAIIKDGQICIMQKNHDDPTNPKQIWATKKEDGKDKIFKIQGYGHYFGGYDSIFKYADSLKYTNPTTKQEVSYPTKSLALEEGRTLNPDEFIISPNGANVLYMQGDEGNLVLYDMLNNPLWTSETDKTTPNNSLYLGSNNKLQLLDKNNSEVIAFPQTDIKALKINNVGKIIVESSIDGRANRRLLLYQLLQGDILFPGEYLYSINRNYTLLMQADNGNLVLKNTSGSILWESDTANITTNANTKLQLTENGGLQMIREDGSQVRGFFLHHYMTPTAGYTYQLFDNPINFLKQKDEYEIERLWQLNSIDKLFISGEGEVNVEFESIVLRKKQTQKLDKPRTPVFPEPRPDEFIAIANPIPPRTRIYSPDAQKYVLFDGFDLLYSSTQKGELKAINPSGCCSSIWDRTKNSVTIDSNGRIVLGSWTDGTPVYNVKQLAFFITNDCIEIAHFEVVATTPPTAIWKFPFKEN